MNSCVVIEDKYSDTGDSLYLQETIARVNAHLTPDGHVWADFDLIKHKFLLDVFETATKKS